MRGALVVTWLTVAAGFLAAPAAFAAETREYGASGRVSGLEGTLYGRGPYDTETSELAANAVLRAGDEVYSDEGTFAEIELPGGTFLRLAGNTTVVINKLDESGVEIALTQGAAYLSRGDSAPPARFQTFAGSVDLGGRSMVRVANDEKKTGLEVSVADGSAELRGERNAQQVRAHETLNTAGGQNRVSGFDIARGDAFDRWNGERESKVRGYKQDAHVASNTMGSYELEGQGTWVQIDGYSAWQPTHVSAGWRPYSEGYWGWTEPWGWSWVDYQPWGYCTSHYGRWYYRNSYGWVWYADPVWAPAWVVWAAFDSSIGWAPCDFWGRPIYCNNYYSYYDYNAWCYSDSGYFYGGGGYHYVTASSRHESVPGAVAQHGAAGARFGRQQIGAGGKFGIHKFDANSIKRATPVPVRDPVRELTPNHIVKAAAEGRIKGASADNRRGDILARATTTGVKPEPWNRKEGGIGGRGIDNGRGADAGMRGPNGIRDGGNGAGANDRLKTEGWSGRVPGNTANDARASEGWNPRGTVGKPDDNANLRGNDANLPRTGNVNDNAARYPGAFDRGTTRTDGPASHFQPSTNTNTNTNDVRGGGDVRGGNQDNGRSTPRYDPPASSGNSDNGRSTPRYDPPASSGNSDNGRSTPRYDPPAPARGSGGSGSSQPAPSNHSAPSAPAPSRSAPAPSHSTPSAPKGKHSSFFSPSSGSRVAFGGGGHSSSSSKSFSFGKSSSGHSSSHSSGKSFHFGKK